MTAAKLQGKRVLLVEDEYFIAEELRRKLAAAGAEILGPVPTAARALALLESSEQVDAALLDVNLRGQFVYPLVDFLSEAGVAMVFVTGYDTSEIPVRYRGIARYQKPVSTDRIIDALAASG
jgi:DNA-binding LytR/AlgR family response regulator